MNRNDRLNGADIEKDPPAEVLAVDRVVQRQRAGEVEVPADRIVLAAAARAHPAVGEPPDAADPTAVKPLEERGVLRDVTAVGVKTDHPFSVQQVGEQALIGVITEREAVE